MIDFHTSFRHVTRSGLWCSIAVCCLVGTAPTRAADFNDIEGRWKLRIDGGGEIYTALLTISEGKTGVAGSYEIGGRRNRLDTIRYSGNTLVVVVNTERFSTPTVATFTADVQGDRLSGEVDFDSGSRSQSYDFSARRVSKPQQSARGAEETDRLAHSDDDRPKDAVVNPVQESGEVSFRNGVDRYDGAVDVEIWAIAPSKSLLKQGTMTTDGNNGGGESQVLLRFENIFGTGVGQIPPEARITSARLAIVAFDPGTTCYVHRLLVPWSESVTWDGMANGITVDNTEASTVRDGFTFAEINMDKQLVHFDVTPTVQLWADGIENHGWVFVNTGGNGWDFYSSDWLETEFRPMLEVSYNLNNAQTKTATIQLSTQAE